MFAHIRLIYLAPVFAGIPLTFLFAVNEFNMFVECQACRAHGRSAGDILCRDNCRGKGAANDSILLYMT